MIISLCTPIMNRLDDLVLTMPHRIENANDSPPVEIVVVDYNSTDGLDKYMQGLMETTILEGGSFFTYRRYTKRDTYHAAHANNLAILSSRGEYSVLTPADVYLEHWYVAFLRTRIDDGCIWCNTVKKHRSTIAILRDEFVSAGGYDERFEMYGPDDIDIIERLERRGGKWGSIPDECISSIYTSPEKKVENYRLKASHKELGKLSMPYYYENKEAGSLVANVGIEWGKW